MSSGREIIGTFTPGLLWRFMLPSIKVISGPYMWSDLTESLVVSGKLRIINYRRYYLKLDVPGQYKYCCNC